MEYVFQKYTNLAKQYINSDIKLSISEPVVVSEQEEKDEHVRKMLNACLFVFYVFRVSFNNDLNNFKRKLIFLYNYFSWKPMIKFVPLKSVYPDFRFKRAKKILLYGIACNLDLSVSEIKLMNSICILLPLIDIDITVEKLKNLIEESKKHKIDIETSEDYDIPFKLESGIPNIFFDIIPKGHTQELIEKQLLLLTT